MARCLRVLLCVFLVFSILGNVTPKRTFGGGSRHTYPKSGGLSGGGHGYPSSGGHGYPSSGGLSGGHSHPSSNHAYPSSGGLSGGGRGYPSNTGSHGYPSSNTGGHNYPSSNPSGGLSGGGHSYPASKGLSGNTPSSGTTNVHHHYHYSPPQQISYAPVHGGPPINYPVYRGTPPTYVYQYKDSGSKYGTLLAGLALLNLGTLAGGLYAHSHSNSNSNTYKTQPGEVCKFGIKKDNGDYEETKIDCQLISSFIYQEQAKTQNGGSNTTVTTTTVTNTTIVNMTNPIQEPAPAAAVPVGIVNYEMMPNGTLVPVNATTAPGVNLTAGVNGTAESSNNNASSSVVSTIITTNTTTVTNALDVKGKPVDVTPGMQCFVIRHTPTTNMRKTIPCGLLQTYAEKSIKRNSAVRNAPAFTVLVAIVAAFVVY